MVMKWSLLQSQWALIGFLLIVKIGMENYLLVQTDLINNLLLGVFFFLFCFLFFQKNWLSTRLLLSFSMAFGYSFMVISFWRIGSPFVHINNLFGFLLLGASIALGSIVSYLFILLAINKQTKDY